jgi:hypothetical protein
MYTVGALPRSAYQRSVYTRGRAQSPLRQEQVRAQLLPYLCTLRAAENTKCVLGRVATKSRIVRTRWGRVASSSRLCTLRAHNLEVNAVVLGVHMTRGTSRSWQGSVRAFCKELGHPDLSCFLCDVALPAGDRRRGSISEPLPRCWSALDSRAKSRRPRGGSGRSAQRG